MWIKTRTGALVNAGPGSVISYDTRPGGQRLFLSIGDREVDLTFFTTNPGVPSRLNDSYGKIWDAIKADLPWFEVDFGEVTPPKAPEKIGGGGSR